MATVLYGAGDFNSLTWDAKNTTVGDEVYFCVHLVGQCHERYVREMRRQMTGFQLGLIETKRFC